MPQKCTATTKNGQPCKSWAIPKSNLCAAHSGKHGGAPTGNQSRRTHGLYSRHFNQAELAALSELIGQQPNLDDEIALAKVINARAVRYLSENPDMPAVEFVALANVALTGTGRVASLLRAWRAISGDAADGIAAAIASALDELSNEWGISL